MAAIRYIVASVIALVFALTFLIDFLFGRAGIKLAIAGHPGAWAPIVLSFGIWMGLFFLARWTYRQLRKWVSHHQPAPARVWGRPV